MKPFLGFGGLFERSLGLILQNFLSTRGGVSSSIFPADSAIFWGSARHHWSNLFSHLVFLFYHLGLIKLAIEASPGALLPYHCTLAPII